MKDVIGSTGGGEQLHGLHAVIDAELDRTDVGEASALEEPEIVEYETRLHNLHDAVVQMELYDQSLDDS